GVLAGGAGAADTVTKNGVGTLILTNSNTFTCPVTIAAGILNVRDSKALGQVSSAADDTTVDDGATLQLEVDNIPDSRTGDTTTLSFNEVLNLTGTGFGSSGAGTYGIGALNSLSGINVWTTKVSTDSSTDTGIGVEPDLTPTANDNYF